MGWTRIPPARRWALLWAVLGAALVVRTGLRDRGVITDHLEFGRRLLHGLDLYAPFLDTNPLHPPYPPSFGLLTAPFSLLPERVARFAWGLLQVGALFAIGRSLAAIGQRLAPGLRRHRHLLLLATALLASRYILRDTHGGGGNLINLALCLTAFVAASRDKPRLAGVLLGASLATKPTFALLLPLFWLFGHRRAAVWALSTAAVLAFAALLLLRLDPSAWQRWLTGTLAFASQPDVFAPPELGFPPFTWMNQSLRCMVARYAGTVPPDLAAEIPGMFPGLGLPPPVPAWTSRLLALGLLLVTATVALRHREPDRRPALLAATLALGLLLSPISWKAHHVALIPAFFVLLIHGARGHRWVWVLASVYLLSCAPGEELIGKAAKNLQQSLYVFTAWDLALWGVCLGLAARAEPPGG